MKLITIFILVTISISIQARTRGEAKSGISSFINSKTNSSSKSDDKNDDDDDDNDDNDDSSSNSSSSSDLEIPVKIVWYWQNMFTPKGKYIQKEGKLVYLASSYTYQSWTPTGINNAKTETTDLSIAKLELSLFFNSIYFSYETSFYGANLEKQRKLLEIRDKEKHATPQCQDKKTNYLKP